MGETDAHRKIAAADRTPGDDAFWYISGGHLCCPWCGESLCHEDASPKAGHYVTQDGEQVTTPPEPAGDDRVKAYHPACDEHKQTERQAAAQAPTRGER